MSRKYRQRGYQESDRDERRSENRPPAFQHNPDNLTPEERIQRRSLRHAIDREANEVIRCHQCGRNIHDFGTLGADSCCPHCTAPLHCCRACVHFDSGARWQCRAPILAAVPDKGRANACPSFAPRVVLDTTGRRSNGQQGPAGPREQFENLFKR
jgi:hypothetical protein